MNNTALGILSALFILVGSWGLSLTSFCGGSTDAPANFSFVDGTFKSKSVDPFSFEKAGIFATIPASTNGELKKIAAHYKSNENRTLSLVGNYYASENYTGDSNLGEERAEVIKNKLVDYGLPEDRITIAGNELKGKLEGTRLYNPVIFKGMEMLAEEVAPVVEEKAFSVLDPFTVRFKSGVAKPEMTDELRNYLDLALAYIGENPDKKLMITGYTDNVGNAKGNISFSKKRAGVIRRLLIDNGVRRKQISVDGKGEANEIQSNDTEEGRALNRRVEITLE